MDTHQYNNDGKCNRCTAAASTQDFDGEPLCAACFAAEYPPSPKGFYCADAHRFGDQLVIAILDDNAEPIGLDSLQPGDVVECNAVTATAITLSTNYWLAPFFDKAWVVSTPA